MEARADLEERHHQVDAEGAAELAHEVGDAGTLTHLVGRHGPERGGVEVGLMKPRPRRESMTMPTSVQKLVSTSAVVVQAKPSANSSRPKMIMVAPGRAQVRRYDRARV
jgi:hypothetical protein